MIKIGRFLPFGAKSFALVGRDFSENQRLRALENPKTYLVEMRDFVGPSALIRIKKPDSFAEIFPLVAQKIRSYSRDSKNFDGKIAFEISGKISTTREN